MAYKNDKCGIYSIYCIENNKRYIGQSKGIHHRWDNHKYLLKNNKHCNNHLQSTWNLHNKNNFLFSIIEECKIEELDDKEKYWITYYNCLNSEQGFNNTFGYKIVNRKKIEKKEIYYKKVLVYKDKELINTFNSIKETSEFYNFNKNRIQECCIGKRYKNGKIIKSYKGYIFLYEDHSKEELEQRYLKKQIENKQKEIKERKKRIGSHNERKVIAKKQEEELEFRSIVEAARSLNTKERYIHRCLSGERQNHKGYIFKYKEN